MRLVTFVLVVVVVIGEAQGQKTSCWENQPIVVPPSRTYSFFLRPTLDGCFWQSQHYVVGHFRLHSPFGEDAYRVQAGNQFCDTTDLLNFKVCHTWHIPPTDEPQSGEWDGVDCASWHRFYGRTSVTCLNQDQRDCQLLASVCMEFRPRIWSGLAEHHRPVLVTSSMWDEHHNITTAFDSFSVTEWTSDMRVSSFSSA